MSDTLQCTKEASVTQDAAVSRLGLPQHFQMFCSAGTTALEGPDLVPRWRALCRSPQHPPTDPQAHRARALQAQKSFFGADHGNRHSQSLKHVLS